MRIILALAFCFLLLSFVSANFQYDDYELKWQLCSAFNYTTTACDMWWEAVAEFPVNETLVVNELNETRIKEIINDSIGQYLQGYYNKTIIDQKNFTAVNDLGEFQSLNQSFENYLESWVDEETRGSDRLLTERETRDLFEDILYENSRERSSGGSDLVAPITIGGIFVFGILIFVTVVIPSMNKKDLSLKDSTELGIPNQATILSRKKLKDLQTRDEQAEEIDKLKKKLEGFTNGKVNKAKSKKPEEFEEELDD